MYLFILLLFCFVIFTIFFVLIQPRIPSFFFKNGTTETSGILTNKKCSPNESCFILTSQTRIQTDFSHDHLVYTFTINETDYFVPEQLYHAYDIGDSITALTNQLYVLKIYKKTG